MNLKCGCKIINDELILCEQDKNKIDNYINRKHSSGCYCINCAIDNFQNSMFKSNGECNCDNKHPSYCDNKSHRRIMEKWLENNEVTWSNELVEAPIEFLNEINTLAPEN